MSVYRLPPSPSVAIPESSYATWHDGFTDIELEKIIALGDKLSINNAVVGGHGAVNKDIRFSKTGWISLNDESQFLYDKLGYIARQLNGQFFDFDIWGFVEDIQYTVYNGNGGHYTWHLDRARDISNSPRKLSLVLQLSDPSEYEGGDLQFLDGHEPTTLEKKKGMVVAFPSFVLHRVTPVTSGCRKTCVVWLSGPRFR